MIERIKNIYLYRDMIFSLVRRDLRGRYKGSVLGFLWSFINPLCQILVYTLVFSFIFRTGIEQFYVYLVAGMIPWIFFSTAVLSGAGCIRGQGEMVKKIYFPREVIPISSVTSAFINMLFCFIFIFLVTVVSGRGLSARALLFLPLIMAIEYIFALGLTLLVAAVTVYLRDVEQIVGVVMMAWIYLTPIMYSIDYVPERFRGIYGLNPMKSIIMAYHDILYYKQAPSMSDLLQSGVVSVVMLIVGAVVFARLERNFAEEL